MDNGIKNIPFVFIMGKGRSGTSLLQNVLDTHINIVAPPEAKFMMLLFPRFSHVREWGKKEVMEFVEALYSDKLFVNLWSVDRDKLTQKLLDTGNLDYELICKLVYLEMANGKNDVKLLADKNPLYVLTIDSILKLYPEAKFIHLVRDPLDNVYSSMKSFHSKNTAFIALQWLSFNKILEEAKQQMPERFFTIKYEELVQNPQAVMEALCGFLGVPYLSEMLNHKYFGETYTSEAKAKAEEIHKSLKAEINTSHIGKWQKEMSKVDVDIVTSITGRFAKEKYDYENNNTGKEIKISAIKLLRARTTYYTWEALTKLRFGNYSFNAMYTKFSGKSIGTEGNLTFK